MLKYLYEASRPTKHTFSSFSARARYFSYKAVFSDWAQGSKDRLLQSYTLLQSKCREPCQSSHPLSGWARAYTQQ